MIWILSVETRRVHRKIFIRFVFTFNKTGRVVKKVNFFGSEFLQMNSNWTTCSYILPKFNLQGFIFDTIAVQFR